MDLDTVAKLLSPFLTAVIGFLVKKYLEARPKLITYMVHASEIPLNDDKGTMVNTHSIVVRNAGKRTAHNVRIGHNYLPKGFQLYPRLTHEIITGDNGAAEILIPTLVPDEQVNISYLYFPPDTWHKVHSYCKSDEMSAKYINIVPSHQLSRLQTTIIWLLLFVGASTVVYWSVIKIWSWVQ
jgi:hypothetical protein